MKTMISKKTSFVLVIVLLAMLVLSACQMRQTPTPVPQAPAEVVVQEPVVEPPAPVVEEPAEVVVQEPTAAPPEPVVQEPVAEVVPQAVVDGPEQQHVILTEAGQTKRLVVFGENYVIGFDEKLVETFKVGEEVIDVVTIKASIKTENGGEVVTLEGEVGSSDHRFNIYNHEGLLHIVGTFTIVP